MVTVMARPAVTAEWQCTKCGTTNRKLVQVDTREAKDRCGSCRARHVIAPGDRPVRWVARAD
jgi:DNA-directed RNA polymerase subunit RPC12/RpoP